MPSDERVRLDHREDVTPLEQRREPDERNPAGIVRAPRFHLPLDVERELLSEKQILSGKPGMGSQREGDERQDVDRDLEYGLPGRPASGMSHVRGLHRAGAGCLAESQCRNRGYFSRIEFLRTTGGDGRA